MGDKAMAVIKDEARNWASARGYNADASPDEMLRFVAIVLMDPTYRARCVDKVTSVTRDRLREGAGFAAC